MRAALLFKELFNLIGVRNETKVFAIGFNKCATTSIHRLFESLGMPSYHGPKWRAMRPILLRTYDCFSDGIPDDLAELDERYPGAKYILQVRDLEPWLYSRLAHISRGKKRHKGYSVSDDWDETEEAVTRWIRTWNDYHISVLRYFKERQSDLLVVNFISNDQAAVEISRFLGFDADLNRPHRNPAPSVERPESHVRLVQQALLNTDVPPQERRNDVYCPSLVGEDTREIWHPASTVK